MRPLAFLTLALAACQPQADRVERPSPPGPAAGPSKLIPIPAGWFWMGCGPEQRASCEDEEWPGRMVYLQAFSIERAEVSVAQYAACVAAGACSARGLSLPRHFAEDRADVMDQCNWAQPGREMHPVNCISWPQARSYCRFLSRRLPSEAEWERAARGIDGRLFPWGAEPATRDPACARANLGDRQLLRAGFERHEPSCDDGHVMTAPVGSFPRGASPCGALDMAGNVWEWVEDFYGPYEIAGFVQPAGPAAGEYRTCRGGSWVSLSSGLRACNRTGNLPDERDGALGFRCAGY
ncbi:MAG: formylglycine-generating enzyme family protein [Deltaproteobacteria bacterium]|nr:formylglycine-generating enzyme family protein [Deltaproteobacteria bacterium]